MFNNYITLLLQINNAGTIVLHLKLIHESVTRSA